MQIARSIMLKVTVALAFSVAFQTSAWSETFTQTEISISGFDLTRFGGPVGTLTLQTMIAEDAIDLAPELTEVGLYEAAAKVTFEGISQDTSGWLQIRNHQNEDALIFTIRFTGDTLPGLSLNTPISGIELHLSDFTGAMLSSTNHAEIPSDFAARFQRDTFMYFLRIGGWGSEEGVWREFTSDSSAAAFASNSLHVSSVPLPPAIFGMLSAAGLLASLGRRK